MIHEKDWFLPHGFSDKGTLYFACISVTRLGALQGADPSSRELASVSKVMALVSRGNDFRLQGLASSAFSV